MKVLAERSCSLLQLSLSWCTKITNNGLTYIANNNNFLTHLNLRGCVNVDDDGITQLVKSCMFMLYVYSVLTHCLGGMLRELNLR